MRDPHLMSRVWRALAVSGQRALVFAPLFLIFLFATLFMVGGDGRAPGVTHMSGGIIQFTLTLLGMGTQGSILTVTLFWSMVFFVASFLTELPVPRSEPAARQSVIDRRNRLGAVLSLLAFVAAGVQLVRERDAARALEDEKRLVLEFVRGTPP